MKSIRIILFVVGVVMTLSARSATSLSYQQYYDDDYAGEEEADAQLSPLPSEEQEDYHVEEEEGGEEEVKEEEHYGEDYGDREPAADYEVEGEFPGRVYDEATPPTPPTHDPLADARSMAVLHVMDKLLKVLGENFGENLPKAPTYNALATVSTPINITAEPCPYKYKRCSSETSFPSCNTPHNTDPEIWSQRFNLYFNLSADFDKMDIINATIRLYKNKSIPLHHPKLLLIKAYAYTRSLTRRRSRTMLVTDTTVSSDYVGWVTLPMDKVVRRWRRARNNHGLLITVTDADTIPWEATNIFVTMSCSSDLVPLPFEVQTDEVGQRYPALNIRQGIPDDEFPNGPIISHILVTPRPAIPSETVTGSIQSDDPNVYPATTQNNYPHGMSDHSGNPHSNYPYATGSRRTAIHNSYPYDTGLAREESVQGNGHGMRGSHEHMVRGSGHDAGYAHGGPYRDITGDYLITNEATHSRHASSPHYVGSVSHHRNSDHGLQEPTEHPTDSRIHTTQSTFEDTLHSQSSEEQLAHIERVSRRESIPTPEPSRPHRQRDSGSAKERRHRRKHHHQRHGSTTTIL